MLAVEQRLQREHAELRHPVTHALVAAAPQLRLIVALAKMRYVGRQVGALASRPTGLSSPHRPQARLKFSP